MGNSMVKEWTVSAIESITDSDAWYMSNGDYEEIKGHDVYFVDFGGAFGYSALVFCECNHIHYANDYQLHHSDKSREELRALYIEKLNRILFTEEEIAAPIADYDEYTRKRYFLQNYYGMREDYISCFHIKGADEEEKERERKISGMVFNRFCFCYHKDSDFVKHCGELFAALEKAKDETDTNYEYQKAAFLHEMFNHEYGINWQADYDTLSAFGNIQYHCDDRDELQKYFDELQFSDLRRKAYIDAREEYFKKAEF